MSKLFVVGIGAGDCDGLTVAAVKRLEASDLIVGYTVYCDLMRPFFPQKEFLATPMMKEIERCRLALEQAAAGKEVSLICSGDAGIYGMASPILELAPQYGVEVTVLPGVTAACSPAASERSSTISTPQAPSSSNSASAAITHIFFISASFLLQVRGGKRQRQQLAQGNALIIGLRTGGKNRHYGGAKFA